MPHRGRRIIGLLAFGAGLLLLGSALGAASRVLEVVIAWWPIAVAIIAAINLASFTGDPWADRNGVALPALVLALILGAAGFLLALTTGLVTTTFATTYLVPAGLVLLGVILVLGTGSRREILSPTVRIIAVLRRTVVHSRSTATEHIDATALLGDVVLDMTKARLEGDPVIHVTLWRGRVSVAIPASWTLDIDEAVVVGDGIEIGEEMGRAEAKPNTQVRRLGLRVMGRHGRVVIVRSPAPTPGHTGRAPTS